MERGCRQGYEYYLALKMSDAVALDSCKWREMISGNWSGSNNDVVESCQLYFGFSLSSEERVKRAKNLDAKYM